MKKYSLLFLLLFMLLISCEGSDTYRGKWKAMDPSGKKSEINFEPKKFAIKSSDGKIKVYEYSQNSVKTENGIETYGIRLDDGRGYMIHFPKKDESVAVILDETGNLLYTISRKSHINQEDIYKLD
ncbi:hypothetical protein NAT51_13970 [Flavobacterium amniphilum]|uniref:hypothetical protein n=1 Tax=Flavobacterium amniphilum TaxID=1834035 RepID=UPI00202A9459|nr:hypothetical protein [Flavobacterium amniphilum]MCL9806638.1 hypothetical protein [Flavobacterium amniphilum]